MNFIKKIFIGNSIEKLNRKPKSAFEAQQENVQKVWDSKNYEDFGIERLLRLFLVCIQFLFPGLYIRYFSGKRNTLTRKICNEIYVTTKILLYILALFVLPKFSWFCYIAIYLMAETFCYLLGLIFLETEYKKPASYKRNLLMAIINYMEVTLGFATIYYCALSDSIKSLHTSIDAIYFSFITATTIGYGEMYPLDGVSKFVCTSQSIVSFLFAVIIISIFLSNLNKNGFLNDDRNEREKKGGVAR